MVENIKLYSEMEKYELINVNDGDKYNYLANNDIILDTDGNLKMIILNEPKTKFGIFGRDEFTEIPWEYVKKIGSRTIILDMDSSLFKRSRIWNSKL